MARILYIEDNEQNLYLVSFILEKAGHEVLAARSGIEGLGKAVEERPDLILLDFQLPEMDGLEVLRRLKADQAVANIPVLAVTSFAMVGDKERFLAAGCSGYLEKPINPDTFLAAVERFLPVGEGEGEGSEDEGTHPHSG